MALFSKEWIRSMRLKRLSNKLSTQHQLSSADDIVRVGSRRGKAIESLYEFMKSDKYVGDVVERRKLTKQDIERLLATMEVVGGGQITRSGLYLPVLALTHHLTLPLVIDGLKTRDEAIETVWQCMEFLD